MNISKPFVVLLALGTSAAAAQPIQVEGNLPTAEVRFGDLNIGRAEGRAALDARVRGAARQICRPGITGELRERMERNACYNVALSGARREVDQILVEYRRTRLVSRTAITVAAR